MCEALNFPVLHAALQKNASGSLTSTALAALRPATRISTSSTASDVDSPIIGGVLKDGQYSWVARGSILVAVSLKTNSVVSIYDFNKIFRELRFVITLCCACENFILVALKSQDGRGCIAVYNPLITRLLKAIDVPYPITSMDLISFCGGAVSATRCLYESLRWFFGIVAVGTEEGHLYLVDLRFDGPDLMEDIPSNIKIVAPASKDLVKTRENAVAANCYLAFELQASSHEAGMFHYALPDHEILESYDSSDVSVTSILYESRVSSLFVGFNFGQFQIVSLQNMNLVFSSDLQGDNAPVCQFSFQEPENDPRNYCYLWAARGQHSTAQLPKAPLTLSMFQLCFSKKEIFGRTNMKQETNLESISTRVLYKDFETCCLRFQHSLGHGFISSYPQCRGSVLHMCLSVEKYTSEAESLELPDNEDLDYCLSPSTSFCIFGWQGLKGKHNNIPDMNIIVFDINRWYMAQMPQRLRGDEDDFLFTGYWSFDDSQSIFSEEEIILGMHVPREKIRHFASGKRPLPERYFFPSSCSFSLHCVTNLSLNYYDLNGYQQQVLNTAANEKAFCLVHPKKVYNDMLISELWSQRSRNQAITPDIMRENILSAALEHGQVAFLLSVIRDLSDGHLAASGCTLRFVMDWAWKSVGRVKRAIDELCVPIFDCTAPALDVLINTQLQFSMAEIRHLRIVFQELVEHTKNASDQSKQELATKLHVVNLIYQYLKVMQWFISNGLLPEQFDNIANDDEIMTANGIFVYKYSRLRQVFDRRRTELKKLNTPDLLLIDGWIEEIGEPLTSRWTKAGEKPDYPPRSLMALLDIYYIDCIEVVKKHCLVMYLLYEVMAMFSALDNEEECSNSDLRRERLRRMESFLETFSVSADLRKLTQGYWLLDHQHFEKALAVLLDVGICCSESSRQERRILRSFLSQGHPTMALKYISARRPKVETLEDVKMHVTIYVESREPRKAWNLVQISVSRHDTSELFSHLFTLYQRHSQLDLLLKLPLKSVEEEMVITYLKESNSLESEQILVLYYLQTFRYVEAIKLHSQSKHIRLMGDQSEESRRRNAKLDHIVQAYSNILPKIEREVAFSGNHFLKPRAAVQREVYKPTLHSAVLHPALYFKPLSQAGRLAATMEKNEQKKRTAQEPLMTPLRRRPLGSKMTDANTCVFPTLDLSKKRSFDFHGSIGRRQAFGSPPRSPVFHDSTAISAFSASAQQTPVALKDERVLSLPMASALLQTPPITRRRPSVCRNDLAQNLQTPQSILKVKKLALSKRNLIPASLHSGPSSCFDKKTMEMEHENDTMESRSDLSDSDDHIKREIPTISTPSANLLHHSDLKRFKFGREGVGIGCDTPKRLRFAGLDSSANDSDLSGINSPALCVAASASNPTLVTQDSDEMDVDVTGTSDSEVTGEYLSTEQGVEEDQAPREISAFTRQEDVVASDEEVGEDLSPPFQEQEFHTPESREEGGEVVCLDSSSEMSEDVQEEEERNPDGNLQKEEGFFQDDDPSRADEKTEAILTFLEEKQSIGQDVLEGTYGSEEFTVEQDYSGDVPHAALSHCLTGSFEQPVTSGGGQEKDDKDDEDQILAWQKNVTHAAETEMENPDKALSQQSIVKGVFLGQHSPDNLEVEDDAGSEAKTGGFNLERDEDQQQETASTELFIPCLLQQKKDVEILASDNERNAGDVKQTKVEERKPGRPVASENQADSAESLVVRQQDDKANIAMTEESKNFVVTSDAHEQDCKASSTLIEESLKRTQTLDIVQGSFDISPPDEGLRLHLSSTEDESFSALEEDAEQHLKDPSGEGEQQNREFPGEQEPLVKVRQHHEESSKDQKSVLEPGSSSVNEDIDVASQLRENAVQEDQSQQKDDCGEENVSKPQDELHGKVVQKSSEKNNESIQIVVNPATPIVERVRNEPEFVLSPPVIRRSKRKASKGTQYAPKPSISDEGKVSTLSAGTTLFTTKQTQVDQSPLPTFTFTPPTTRSRSSKKKERSHSTLAAEQMNTLSPQPSSKRTRRKTRSSDESNRSSSSTSPARRSARKKVSSKTTEQSSVRDPPSTPPDKKLPLTPTRRTRQSPARTRGSPGRMHPQTPTRSSSRIRAKFISINKSASSEGESVVSTLKPQSDGKETSSSSAAGMSEAEVEETHIPATPPRRSARKSLAKTRLSPAHEAQKIPILTPLPEEKLLSQAKVEMGNKKRKKDRKPSDRCTATTVTKINATYATRMRRKAKIFQSE